MPKQPFVRVPNVVRLKLEGTTPAGAFNNLFYVQYTGTPPSNADLNMFCFGVHADWAASFGTFYPSTVHLVKVSCWDLTDENAAIGVDTTDTPGSGTMAMNLAANSAYCVSWPVNSRWRGGHFRTYLPARNTSDLTNGVTIGTSPHNDLVTVATNWKSSIDDDAMGTATTKLVGVRYFPTGVGVVRTSGIPYLFGTPLVHRRVDSQRGRTGRETG